VNRALLLVTVIAGSAIACNPPIATAPPVITIAGTEPLLAPSASTVAAANSAPPAPRPPTPIAWETSERDARDRARQQRVPLLVFVRAAWALASIEMEREAWADPRVAALALRVVPLRLDVTSGEGDAELYAQRYGISGVPETILLDPGGRPLTRLLGRVDADRLFAELTRALDE
jgi:thiol:disulfide interchange protein